MQPDEIVVADAACLCILGAGTVLLISRRTMLRAAMIQGLPPLIALVLIAIVTFG